MTNSIQSPSTIRVLGGILMFLGTILIGAMGAIMWWINNIIANSGKYSSTTKWNGSPEQTQITFLILGAVLVFGLAAFSAGLWQVVTSKRNMKLIILMLVLWACLLITAWAVPRFF